MDFTAFGGPSVHFGILHRRFVEGRGGKALWLDEQTVCSGLDAGACVKWVKFSFYYLNDV
ncbi:hypothetical protein V1504DRAFT_464325, partial [Lipomyces starkeyi]